MCCIPRNRPAPVWGVQNPPGYDQNITHTQTTYTGTQPSTTRPLPLNDPAYPPGLQPAPSARPSYNTADNYGGFLYNTTTSSGGYYPQDSAMYPPQGTYQQLFIMYC